MKSLMFSLRTILPLLVFIFVFIQLASSYLSSRQVLFDETLKQQKSALENRLGFIQSSFELFLNEGKFHSIPRLTASIASDPDLVYLVAADYKGNVVASNLVTNINRYWNQLDIEMNSDAIKQVIVDHKTLIEANGNKLDGYTSFCLTQSELTLRAEKCGFIFYQIDLKYHYQRAGNLLKYNTLYNLMASFIGIVILLIATHYLITKRTLNLIEVLKKYASGIRTIRTNHRFGDEIAALGSQVNHLFEHINTTEDELHDREQRLDNIFNTVPDAIIITDSSGIILRTNPATERLFHYPEGDLMGKSIKTILLEQFKASVKQQLETFAIQNETHGIGPNNRITAQRKDCSTFPVEATFSLMNIKGQSFHIGVFRDISVRTEMEEVMRKVNEQLMEANRNLTIQADTDGLTGLANRMHFDRVYNDEIHRSLRKKEPISVLMCDVDYFKNYNDYYGHQAGDECLKQVAHVLSAFFKRSGELVARYGGEEFVIILPNINYAHARYAAHRALEQVRRLNIVHAKSDISDILTMSIGIASYEGCEKEPLVGEKLLKLADDALYQAKDEGRNRIILKYWANINN